MIKSMKLIVAEKRFKDATNHKLEATIGMMVSGNQHFPVLFGETSDSIIMEFVGDPETQRPGDTIHATLKLGGNVDWSSITKQIINAFAALHSKGILHCDIHAKNVLLHAAARL